MLLTIVNRDLDRLRSKGYSGILISIILAALLPPLTVCLMHAIWPNVLDLYHYLGVPKDIFSFVTTYAMSILSLLTINLAFLGFYLLRSPLIERYKVIKDEKWPWLEDPVAWRPVLRKTLATVIFNTVILQPVFFTALIQLLGSKVPYGFTQEGLPSTSTLIWQIVFCIYVEDVG